MLEPSYMAAGFYRRAKCDVVLYTGTAVDREISAASCILRWLCEYL
jgi:hypothetical protein